MSPMHIVSGSWLPGGQAANGISGLAGRHRHGLFRHHRHRQQPPPEPRPAALAPPASGSVRANENSPVGPFASLRGRGAAVRPLMCSNGVPAGVTRPGHEVARGARPTGASRALGARRSLKPRKVSRASEAFRYGYPRGPSGHYAPGFCRVWRSFQGCLRSGISNTTDAGVRILAAASISWGA